MNKLPTTKKMILTICALRNHAQTSSYDDKAYKDLLSLIYSEDYFWDESIDFPTVKELVERSGLTTGKFNRLVKSIYQDLVIQPEKSLKLDITEVEYEFSIGYYGRYIYFTLDHLPEIPRVGEQFSIPHFNYHLGSNYFHVESIYHSFEDTKQVVTIVLKNGEYNKYWHIRRDEAECRREVPYDDLHNLSDYHLKRKLGLIPKHLI